MRTECNIPTEVYLGVVEMKKRGACWTEISDKYGFETMLRFNHDEQGHLNYAQKRIILNYPKRYGYQTYLAKIFNVQVSVISNLIRRHL